MLSRQIVKEFYCRIGVPGYWFTRRIHATPIPNRSELTVLPGQQIEVSELLQYRCYTTSYFLRDQCPIRLLEHDSNVSGLTSYLDFIWTSVTRPQRRPRRPRRTRSIDGRRFASYVARTIRYAPRRGNSATARNHSSQIARSIGRTPSAKMAARMPSKSKITVLQR